MHLSLKKAFQNSNSNLIQQSIKQFIYEYNII